jgi:hypothetical protein
MAKGTTVSKSRHFDARSRFIGPGLTLEQCLLRASGGLGSGGGCLGANGLPPPTPGRPSEGSFEEEILWFCQTRPHLMGCIALLGLLEDVFYGKKRASL